MSIKTNMKTDYWYLQGYEQAKRGEPVDMPVAVSDKACMSYTQGFNDRVEEEYTFGKHGLDNLRKTLK